MSIIYGADSTMPASTKLTNGYTLYEWVMRKSCFPSFWARDIVGKNVISKDEIDYLRSKKCRIALVIRELSEIETSQNDGSAMAIKAIEAAKALGVPQYKALRKNLCKFKNCDKNCAWERLE